jgi:DNA polymerase-1
MTVYAFDTETYLFQPGLAAPRLVCGSWANSEQQWVGNQEDTIRFFVESLERGDHLVGVNLAYDLVVLAAFRPELLPLIFKAGNAGQFHDCSIREALNDIAVTGKVLDEKDDGQAGRYSMAFMMQRHFNADISGDKVGDVWRYKYAQLDGVPLEKWPQAAVDYPKLDARRTYDIWAKQAGFKNLHDEPNQVRASIAIQLMVTWGLRTDGAYIAHLEKEVDQVWNEARTEFAKHGIFRPDGSKDKKLLAQMVDRAYAGKPPRTQKSKSFPTGQISTDRDTLLESGVPILEKLGASGKNDKRKTTYIPALKRGIHVPINPSFNVLVGTTRVSSDWQQMPQKGGIREAVYARPGYLLGSLDYGGLELRTMSQRAILNKRVGFSKMAEYINSGKDPHCYVGGFFMGLTYEQFLARKTELKSFRDVAKIFNFGAGGGAGGFAIAYNAKVKDNIRLCLTLNRAEKCGVNKDVGFIGGKQKRVCSLCVAIAKELKKKWLQAWPEQGLLSDIAGELTAGKRKVKAVVFSSGVERGECGFSQWLNTPFQGAGGDGTKRAMWRIQEEAYTARRSPLWGTRKCLQVHDELIFEFPEGRHHDAAFRAAKIMVDTMNEITPDVRNECTPAVMRRLFKAATDVYDHNRNLKPWWPDVWAWQPDQEVMQRDRAA